MGNKANGTAQYLFLGVHTHICLVGFLRAVTAPLDIHRNAEILSLEITDNTKIALKRKQES